VIVFVFFLSVDVFIIYVVKNRVSNIEQRISNNYIARFQELLLNEIKSIEKMTVDWAVFDATYDFINDQNEEYIEENIPNHSILNDIGINLILFINREGQLIAGFMTDSAGNKLDPVPETVRGNFTASVFFNRNNYLKESNSGMILIPNGILFASSYPIFRTDREGGSNGYLVMARFLTRNNIEKYASILNVELKNYSLNQSSLPDSVQQVIQTLAENDSSDLVFHLSDKKLSKYFYLKDMNNQKIALMRITIPRTIWQESKKTIYILMIIPFLFYIVLVIFIFYLFDKNVLKRLNYMKKMMITAIKNQKYDTELVIHENDEIGQLANSYNKLMQKILDTYEEMEITSNIFNNALDELMIRHLEYDREFKMARRIQLSLLPKESAYKNENSVDLGFYYQAMEKLGGDIYDIIHLSDRYLGFYIGDVSGHGVTASLITSQVKVHFQSFFKQEKTVSQIFQQINTELLKVIGDYEYYITVFAGIYDRETRILSYANAGHFPPVFLPKNGQEKLLELTGVFIGTFVQPEWETAELFIEPGDKLFCYTDGMLDMKNNLGLSFGKEKLVQALAEIKHFPPNDMISLINHQLNGYKKNLKQQDDVAILCIEFK